LRGLQREPQCCLNTGGSGGKLDRLFKYEERNFLIQSETNVAIKCGGVDRFLGLFKEENGGWCDPETRNKTTKKRPRATRSSTNSGDQPRIRERRASRKLGQTLVGSKKRPNWKRGKTKTTNEKRSLESEENLAGNVQSETAMKCEERKRNKRREKKNRRELGGKRTNTSPKLGKGQDWEMS